LPRAKPQRVAFFYALLRRLAYSAARLACPPWRANAPRSRKLSEFGARDSDDDDFVFDCLDEVLLSSLAALLRQEFAFQAHCNEHPPRTTGD
jgi:hypothetical protein